jgi:hypothetical protein
MKDLVNSVFNAHKASLSFEMIMKLTASLMLSCSFIISSRELIGDPISCEAIDVPKDVINNFCWVNSTFTLVNDTQRYYNWYQWVSLMFCIQSVMLCLPSFLWKAFEGGKLEMVTRNLSDSTLPVSEKKKLQETLTEYVKGNLNRHNTSAIVYLIYEVGNFVMALGQLLFVHWFLGGFSETQKIDNLETVSFS